jgi:hypothetical protein
MGVPSRNNRASGFLAMCTARFLSARSIRHEPWVSDWYCGCVTSQSVEPTRRRRFSKNGNAGNGLRSTAFAGTTFDRRAGHEMSRKQAVTSGAVGGLRHRRRAIER